jgi:WXG100 family type VII secretion target
MSQAIVDPEQLRRFAHNLKRFNSDLQNQLMTLHGQLKNLSQTWRDKEQQKFNEEFEQTMLALSKFIETADAHVPFLLRKADRAEEYLRQR